VTGINIGIMRKAIFPFVVICILGGLVYGLEKRRKADKIIILPVDVKIIGILILLALLTIAFSISYLSISRRISELLEGIVIALIGFYVAYHSKRVHK
jgi:uncharacterized BrkB/YihY/UPF0761 family membrane protein